MPSKKKKYNARFPAGRIKKIMQTDEEVGKVAQAVPSTRTLELFVESLLTKTLKITNARNAKTLSPSHMKQCIISESRFDFLRDLVKNIPDMGINEELSGSEAGYGNEGTSPASTSTSSSSASYSNGGGAAATASASASLIAGHHHHLPYEMVHPTSLQRSESYTPATASISLLPQHHHHNSQPSHGKRGLSQGGSLNFYKEIPLEGTESPPPPKLNRLNSAPAAAPSAPSLEPVIKLDYSNLRLPATSASPHGSRSTGPVPVPSSSSSSSSLQPTIKIDLSSLATGGTTALSSA
ncbi:AGAP010678-PA, partial [Anopheles gambiae str. PEST]